MEVFETIISVKKDDLDQLNHVNNVKYVQWVQDIAEAHWLKKASDNIRKNVFWVMISHSLEYKSASFLGDDLGVKTYVSSSEGVISTRHVEFINKTTNKLVVKSITKWCLMNSSTQRPTRITKELKELFQ